MAVGSTAFVITFRVNRYVWIVDISFNSPIIVIREQCVSVLVTIIATCNLREQRRNVLLHECFIIFGLFKELQANSTRHSMYVQFLNQNVLADTSRLRWNMYSLPLFLSLLPPLCLPSYPLPRFLPFPISHLSLSLTLSNSLPLSLSSPPIYPSFSLSLSQFPPLSVTPSLSPYPYPSIYLSLSTSLSPPSPNIVAA